MSKDNNGNQPTNQPTNQDKPLFVGIGASAGGLEALKELFSSFPDNPGMAFIVILHLSPDHESSMAELLQSHTSLEVMQVNEKTQIQPDCVYVIPPGKGLVVGDNHLELTEPEKRDHTPKVIDQFYRSLGEIKGDRAVSITLSGTGSDGAVGIKSIKEGGGCVFVQDPGEAQYPGMPQSAINTGLADKVLPIEEIPKALINYKKSLSAVRISDDPGDLSKDKQSVLSKIFKRIRDKTDHDFSHYKRSTMLRRIQRRMHVHSAESLDEYLSVLKDNPEEAVELFKDLLISVTDFFRDPEAFEALEENVIPKLFEGKHPDDELRVWVPGCATGEEAYSIAMLLHKYARNIDRPPSIQIFATDIDEQALEVARQGRYPESVTADLTDQNLRRFFRKDGYEYVVGEELRNIILFSKHNLLGNPPFSNQDLVSCRNLLIYLDKDLQGEVFNLFHYTLNEEGFLFLGGSDSNMQATEQFKPFIKKYRIYRPATTVQANGHLPDLPLQLTKNKPSVSHSWKMPSQTKTNFEHLHQKLITREYGPASVIINESEEVLHSAGGTRKYLNYTEGEPSRNVLDMVISEFRQPLRSILYRAKKDGTDLPVRKQVQVKVVESLQSIEITLHRINEKDFPDDLMYIVFRELGDVEPVADPEPVDREDISDGEVEIIEELESELRQTKEQLQMTVEDYETANEELRSSNEELQSMNEELQSTTEELETSREELQSVNEELKTVNQELESKIEDLSRANNDLKNLMEATEIGIIFVDRDLQLKRFTDKATDLFNLTSTDEGRPIDHFTHRLTYDSFIEDIEDTLDNLERHQKEVTAEGGRSYIMRLRPYQTTGGDVKGVVITFVDVSELKNTQEKLAQRMEQIKDLQREIIKNNVEERWKIGQYLHDELAQSLIAAQLSLGRVRGEVGTSESNLAEELDRLSEIIDQNIDDARDLSHEIVPVDVEQKGVETAFNNLAKYIEKTYDLNCVLEGNSVMDGIGDIGVATHLYRIAREAAKNAAIHGEAENLKITLQSDEKYLYLDIEDDGQGFAATEGEDDGMGIQIMRHRMELMGGTLETKESSHFENTGALIACKMPMEGKE